MAAAIRLTIDRSEPGAQRDFALESGGLHVVLDLLAAAARQDPSLALSLIHI